MINKPLNWSNSSSTLLSLFTIFGWWFLVAPQRALSYWCGRAGWSSVAVTVERSSVTRRQSAPFLECSLFLKECCCFRIKIALIWHTKLGTEQSVTPFESTPKRKPKLCRSVAVESYFQKNAPICTLEHSVGADRLANASSTRSVGWWLTPPQQSS